MLRLSFTQKFALITAAITAIAAPIMVGFLNAPARAQSSQIATQPAQAGQSPAEAPRPQASTTPKFEVVSVKACKADLRPGAGRGGTASGNSPATLREDCATVSELIRQAYVEYASEQGSTFPQLVPIQGGPSWINFERYEIDAKAEGAPGQGMLRGPMLQTILQDRFNLKIHRDSRDVPVYALTVAKGGVKLQPTKESSCVPMDSTPAAPGVQFCGMPRRGDKGLHLIGATMADLCKILSVPEISDRPTIDKTGITGMFDIPLPGPRELRGSASTPADPAAPVASDDSSPFEAMRAALQAFGLNLERAKGGGEFLAIDHVERPSGN